MRGTVIRIYLALVAVVVICSCSMDEPIITPAPFSSDNVIKVTGRMTPFTEINPDTKSTKNQYETTVKNMAMFVFDSDGAKVDYQFVSSSQPLFLIDRNNNESYSGHTQTKMAACKIYILANIPTADQTTLNGITTEAGFLATDCTISNVIRTSEIESYGGLPMWGVINQSSTGGNIDLRKDSELGGATNPLIGQVLTIPLTCMMSKLTFNITVDPVQKSDYIQRFELKSWTVENAPAEVRVAQPTGTNESAHADSGPFLGAVTFGQVDNGVNPIMQGGSTAMTFCCYVPEHRVSPDNTVTYPTGVVAGDQVSQNFKPDWLADGQKPIKVTLKGVYTDHRNQEKEVTYTLFPGANNYNDFFVERNHEYIHNISIKGISNNKDGEPGTISVDLRVDVEQNDFKFELERETLLDSHWEIRPIRITLDPTLHENADHIEVEIIDGDLDNNNNPWIRFEAPTADQINASSGATSGTYCYASSGALAYGKRRYFTTDLVTNTLKNNTLVTFRADETSNTGIDYEHVIWVYIDENVTGAPVSGSNTRQATVQCRYYEKNNPDPVVTENYYFIQKSLHGISYNSHNYGIEYFEEYLYNFDSRDDFTALPDGMAWGLNGVQLSKTYNAISMTDPTFNSNFMMELESAVTLGTIKNTITSNVNTIVDEVPNKYGAKYDFYLSVDGVTDVEIRDYHGLDFTKEIASTSIAQSEMPTKRQTNQSVESAIEYCLNKNKRNSDGTININAIRWYLPSIDEIEEITMGGYSDFEVFQDKYYWSSQPSYKGISIEYDVTCWTTNAHWAEMTGSSNGIFYKDNVHRARATKVYSDQNNVFHNEYSGTTGTYGRLTIYHEGIYNKLPDPSYTLSEDGDDKAVYQNGNMPRTGNNSINRVRCVYKAD